MIFAFTAHLLVLNSLIGLNGLIQKMGRTARFDRAIVLFQLKKVKSDFPALRTYGLDKKKSAVWNDRLYGQ